MNIDLVEHVVEAVTGGVVVRRGHPGTWRDVAHYVGHKFASFALAEVTIFVCVVLAPDLTY